MGADARGGAGVPGPGGLGELPCSGSRKTRWDVASLPENRVAAAAELDAWAEGGVGDWRRALERFAEDHAPVHLRPDPDANAALRRLRRTGTRIVVVTDAPEPLARVALAHLGVARSVDEVATEPPHGAAVVHSADDLAGHGYDQG